MIERIWAQKTGHYVTGQKDPQHKIPSKRPPQPYRQEASLMYYTRQTLKAALVIGGAAGLAIGLKNVIDWWGSNNSDFPELDSGSQSTDMTVPESKLSVVLATERGQVSIQSPPTLAEDILQRSKRSETNGGWILQRLGGEFQVNTYISSAQSNPSIIYLNETTFVVSWQSNGQDRSDFGIYGQVFELDSNNMPISIGNEFPVNTRTNNAQTNPSITHISGTRFVISWQGNAQDGDGFGVYGQVFDASAKTTPSKIGNEFQINSYTNSHQFNPHIVKLSDTRFVVSWQSREQDGSDYGVYGQVFEVNGTDTPTKIGSEFLINSHTMHIQSTPSLASLSETCFIVSWQSNNQDGSRQGVYGQVFEVNGKETPIKVGVEFLANNFTADDQSQPSIAPLNETRFVLVWQSNEQDGSGYGAYGQLFERTGNAAPIKIGSEFLINSYTNSDQFNTDITQLSDTHFVVTWQSLGQGGSGYGIYGQIFEATGDDTPTKIGTEIQINSHIIATQSTPYDQSEPSITKLGDMQCVVTWVSGSGPGGQVADIYGQVFELVPNTGVSLVANIPTQLISTTTALDIAPYFRDSENQTLAYDYRLVGADQLPTWLNVPENRFDSRLVIDYQLSNITRYYQVEVTANDGEFSASTIIPIIQSRMPLLLRVGDEFQINNYTANHQTNPTITTLNESRFVVSWMSLDQDGSGYGVYGQVVDVHGSHSPKKVGNEFQINSHTTNHQAHPMITTLSPSRFVASWMSMLQDESGFGVYGQVVDVHESRLPEKVGSEFRINNYTTNDQVHPTIATLSTNHFVVSWSSRGQNGITWSVYGQVFDVSGNATPEKVGNEFQINTYTINNQETPTITALSETRFVVIWQSEGQDESGTGIYGQIFDVSGDTTPEKVGSEFQVNSHTINDQSDPTITTLSPHRFVVSWRSNSQARHDRSVHGQLFEINGGSTPVNVGSEFQINTYTTNHQQNPTITTLSENRFVVSWESIGQDESGLGIYGQIFEVIESATPVKMGNEFQINNYTTDHQASPVITTLSSHRFVVSWVSNNGDSLGVYGQVFDLNTPPILKTPLQPLINVNHTETKKIDLTYLDYEQGDTTLNVAVSSYPDGLPDWMTLDQESQELIIDPKGNMALHGTYIISVSATDDKGLTSDERQFLLNVALTPTTPATTTSTSAPTSVTANLTSISTSQSQTTRPTTTTTSTSLTTNALSTRSHSESLHISSSKPTITPTSISADLSTISTRQPQTLSTSSSSSPIIQLNNNTVDTPPNSSGSGSSSNVPIIVGSVLGGVLVMSVGAVLIVRRLGKTKKNDQHHHMEALDPNITHADTIRMAERKENAWTRGDLDKQTPITLYEVPDEIPGLGSAWDDRSYAISRAENRWNPSEYDIDQQPGDISVVDGYMIPIQAGPYAALNAQHEQYHTTSES